MIHDENDKVMNWRIEAVQELDGRESYFWCSDTETKWKNNDHSSEEVIIARMAELKADWEAKSYQRDRQYPELGEQLDMLFHDMTAGKGSKDGEWYKAIAKVKAEQEAKLKE